MAEKITKELVFDLADQMVLQGIDPTNLKIRDMNESRGSLSSITPHLKAWREQRSAEAAESLPDMPEERLLAVLRPVWAELARESQAILKAEQAAFNQERSQFKVEADNYMTEIDRQSVAIERQADEIAGLLNSLTDAREQFQQQSLVLSTMTERAEQQTQRIDNLNIDKLNVDKQCEELRSQLVAKSNHGEQLKVELASVNLQNNELKGQLNAALEQASSLSVQLNASQEQVEEANKLLTTEQQRATDLAEQYNQQERTIATTSTKLESVTQQLQEAKQVISEKDKQVVVKQEAEIILKSELKACQAELKQVNAEMGRTNIRADKLEANLIALTENLHQVLVKPESNDDEKPLNSLNDGDKE